MKKNILLGFLFFTVIVSSQRRYAADRYFKEFAYVKAAELYERIYKKGDSSKLVVTRLGDSYYLNLATEKSEFWYKKLFELYAKDTIPAEYYFKLSQSLKSNGKYKESDQWLLKLRDVSKDDSRAKRLVDRANYFSEYTNKEKTFVNIKNLSVNTEYSDFGPFISKNKRYFSSTRPDNTLKRNKLYAWNKQPFLNIYEAKDTLIDNDLGIKINDIAHFEKVKGINTKYHEASAITTKNGKKMFFTRDNYDGKKLKSDKNRTTHLKIYQADLINDEWSNVKELPFNNDDYAIGHPALSPDEKELYFVSDMPGGYGKTDLYKVQILSDSTYSKPINLGEKINTEGKEMFPFISNQKILYFSSNGHIGLGALDVFETKIMTDGFGEVVNLGSPVNSVKDDFYFVIDKDKKRGYFSSNREGGKGDDDMYSFTIYNCKEVIEGVVYDSSNNKPLDNVKVKLIDANGNIVTKITTDKNGVYSFGTVDCNKKFTVVGDLDYFVSDLDELSTKDEDKLIIASKLFLKPLIVENQIVINPIFFDFNKSNIREDAEYELEKVVTVMQQYPELVIKIESHTDSRGRNNYNRKLSDRRAKSSRDYIVSRGIAASRIESAIGYGEDRLLNACDDINAKKCSDEQHQKNRRSYFYIVKGKNKVKSFND